ncbi:MAG: hypothetical protein ACFE8A_03175 [Candidatus Hodarchaeota archaeon]
MQRKLSKEELAQKAIELLDNAENFEEKKEWYKAIENYQKAAEFLQQSGYLTHRIQDIYTRATEINNYLKQQKAYEYSQAQIQKAQLDQLQDQAFILLDEAKAHEESGNLHNAIQNYLSAIKLLTQSGWSEIQLENLKSKIVLLAEIYESRKGVKADIQAQVQPQVSEITAQPILDKKIMALKVYEEKKKQEKEMQNKAFDFLETAKIYEKDKKYDEAITNYQKAIELLNSLGWTQQTQDIQLIVDKLRIEQESYVTIQVQQDQATMSIGEKLLAEQPFPQSEIDIKKQKLIEFEQKKKKEEELQNKAFKLIDTAKRLEREKRYDKALQYFEESINLLNSIGWDDYTQPIIKSVNHIKERKEREIHAEEIRKRREVELTKLQKMIQTKQKEEFVESTQESELRRREFEQKRHDEFQKEEEFYAILNEADKLVQQSNYDNAINEYKKALDKLSNMGSGWESYIPTLQETISSIDQRKKAIVELQHEQEGLEEEKRLKVIIEERKQQQRAEKIAQQMAEEERNKLIQAQMSAREVAYSLLEEAGNYLKGKEPNFDSVISLHIQARNILEENIGWEPEINNINRLIQDLQHEKAMFLEKRKLEEQAKFEREQEYIAFQQELKRRSEEYEKEEKRRRTELEEFEERRQFAEELKQQALGLIDEGKKSAKFGKFDKAYEIFNKAISQFIEMGWKNHIHYIETEINNTKLLEERTKKEELELRRIHEELENQVSLEKLRRQEEDRRIRSIIGEIGDLADDVKELIETRREKITLEGKEKEQLIKREAKEFSRSMAKMIKIKQELQTELENAKKKEAKKLEEIQKAEDRKDLDEIARMIKDAAKKEK